MLPTVRTLYSDCDGKCLDCPESDFLEKYESGKSFMACRFACNRFGERGTFKYDQADFEEKLKKYFEVKGEF